MAVGVTSSTKELQSRPRLGRWLTMDFCKSIGRAVKFGALQHWADNNAMTAGDDAAAEATAAVFLIGCGRSGTTILGSILESHPSVHYFFEPYHLWATIDPTIDVLRLYRNEGSKFLLDEKDCTQEAKRRFNRLLMDPANRRGARLMVEKTPFNACRIGYLEGLKPGAKFIHIARDGVDIARSIDRLSRDHSHSIFSRPALNRWWGCNGCKWDAMRADGIASGYFPEEVGRLSSYGAKGAYEWLMSIAEVDRWRERLGPRLLELTYEDFTKDPKPKLREVCEFLELGVTEQWIEASATKVDKARRNAGETLVLPKEMCERFNEYQQRFGFAGRAAEGELPLQKPRVAIISNEPTPYRLHALERFANEIPEAEIDNIFTHSISTPSMPWVMELDPKLNSYFSAAHHLRPGRPISIRSMLLYREICQYVADNEVKMIFLSGYNDLTRLGVVWWSRLAGLPVLLMGDSNIFADALTGPLMRQLKAPVLRWVLRRLSGLMPMGKCGRAFYKRYADHQLPEFLCPYEPDYAGLRAVSDEKIKAFAEKYQLAGDRKRMLFCGRLVEVKCVDILMRAFIRVAGQRPDWDLVIAGDGRLRTRLEEMIPPELSGRVKWLGFLQFEDVSAVYHSCHVLVHPAEFEPWGLVINEAVACDLPVISTSVVGAAVELVKHDVNGVIVPPRNVEALVDAMLRVTEKDRYVQMGRECAAQLEHWRRVADPVESIRKAMKHFKLL